MEGRQSADDDIRAIQQVTVADVDRVARLWLKSGQSVSAILSPQTSGNPTSSASYGGAESFALKETGPSKLPAWAEKVTRLSIPASTVHPVVTTLANGLKLIVQLENISDTISVFGHIKNNADLESPKGKEGVDEALDQLLSHGTTSMDRLAFQKALDDIGANESAGTDFSLEVPGREFERGVELLAANELHPALPESAFQVIQPQLSATVAGELRSPGYLARRALESALLPKDDPELRQATPETVSSISLDDVRKYHKMVFRPDLTTIVVIGQVTPQRARSVIERNFGEWKSQGPAPGTNPPPVPRNKRSNTVVPNASRVQDEVTLAASLPLSRLNPDYYALNLGNRVLGGAFYASRLSRDLRENTGLVYTVSSSLGVGPTRTVYAVSYGCDPPNVAKARAIVIRDLKEMETEPIPKEVLYQAKVLLLQQMTLSESSLSSIAQGLISRAKNDLPLDEPTRAAQKYVKLTASDVQSAFAAWIRPDDLVQVTEGPIPK